MWKAIRLTVLLVVPLLFWGAWYAAPALLEAEGLKWLSGPSRIVVGLEFYFFRRLSEVSNVQGITTKRARAFGIATFSLAKEEVLN